MGARSVAEAEAIAATDLQEEMTDRERELFEQLAQVTGQLELERTANRRLGLLVQRLRSRLRAVGELLDSIVAESKLLPEDPGAKHRGE